MLYTYRGAPQRGPHAQLPASLRHALRTLLRRHPLLCVAAAALAAVASLVVLARALVAAASDPRAAPAALGEPRRARPNMSAVLALLGDRGEEWLMGDRVQFDRAVVDKERDQAWDMVMLARKLGSLPEPFAPAKGWAERGIALTCSSSSFDICLFNVRMIREIHRVDLPIGAGGK
eukprot:m51a1_g10343 hypothetical protein (176) ;mRNA; f:144385-145041